MDWICQPQWTQAGKYNIWKAVLQEVPLIRDGITWRIQSGEVVKIGMDHWIGCGNTHRLPHELKTYLTSRGISHFSQIADNDRSNFLQQAWKSRRALQIPQQWQQHWKEYIEALTESHNRIQEGGDELIWAHAKHGKYSPKEGYITLMNSLKPPTCELWWRSLWKLKAPPRSRLLMWTIL